MQLKKIGLRFKNNDCVVNFINSNDKDKCSIKKRAKIHKKKLYEKIGMGVFYVYEIVGLQRSLVFLTEDQTKFDFEYCGLVAIEERDLKYFIES